MIVAVFASAGSFSDRWSERVRDLGHEIRLIDAAASDAIRLLRGAEVLLWHYSHTDGTAMLMADPLLTAAEAMGVRVFPNHATRSHFDDKVAQKYLLEAVDAPLVPSWVFYDRAAALHFIEETRFPIVFKLRRGAGSVNVQLVRDRSAARRLVTQAFGPGFRPVGGVSADAANRVRRVRSVADLAGKLRRLPRTLANIAVANRLLGRERGYVYFQEFVPGNKFDTRVTIIGERAFAFTRGVRPGDFRASGSGNLDYDHARINRLAVERAFAVARRLRLQSAAFDFVLTPAGEPLIVEVSYSYLAHAVHRCGGYFDRELVFHPGPVWPQDAILDDLLAAR